MKFNVLALAAALSLSLAAVQTASAGTLVSQPWDGGSNLFSSQNDTNPGGNGNFATTYDDFTLAHASALDGFQFTGGYFNPANQGPITAWTLTFYNNNAGVPGNPIAIGSFPGTGDETFLASVNGFPIYSYELDFQNFDVSAGTYWASVVPDIGFPPQWGWATGTGGNLGGYQCFFGACGPTGTDFAFNLLGSAVGVPEPATWAMMLVGLFGLGAAMRSRRQLASATA
jgi:hypothetical protein